MKLRRLWQPQNPVFWLMVVFNLLSSLCAWALRSFALPYPLMLVIAGVAVGNVVFGFWCAWLLMTKEPSRQTQRSDT